MGGGTADQDAVMGAGCDDVMRLLRKSEELVHGSLAL